jgi:hypothetical protein
MLRRSRWWERIPRGQGTAGGRPITICSALLIREGLAGSPDLAAAVARVRTVQGLTQQAGAVR